MQVLNYPCPCCGAPLQYSGAEEALKCASCGNAFDLEAVKSLQGGEEQEMLEFTAPSLQFSQEEAAAIAAFACQSCGAELMAEATTTATVCPYCGSAAVLPGQIAQGVRPERVLPFRIGREEAVQKFNSYFAGKRLLPNVFVNSQNRIAEMRQLYVPYWLFDCNVRGDMAFDAEKQHKSRQGEWEVTRTEHYAVQRSGSLQFSNVPVNGCRKLSSSIAESLEPYDVSAAVPFAPAVLAGAMADRADVGAAECEVRAAQRMSASMEEALRATVTGYSSVSTRRRSIQSSGGRATPVLMPVWLITTEKQQGNEKKTYTFAINGQTGRLTCDVPPDPAKSRLWFGGVGAGVFAAGYGLAALLSRGAPRTLYAVLAAVVALIAAFCVVGGMKSKLKTARAKSNAADYAGKGALQLSVRQDRYLYSNEQRRRVEQNKTQPR